jgi:butyrate response factor 1
MFLMLVSWRWKKVGKADEFSQLIGKYLTLQSLRCSAVTENWSIPLTLLGRFVGEIPSLLEALRTKMTTIMKEGGFSQSFKDKNATDAWLTPVVLQTKQTGKLDESKLAKNIEQELSKQSLYKTELCRSFGDTGFCNYGQKCQFAHGEHELRPILRHPKYKTEVCKTFTTTGQCPYGNRCRFIHGDQSTEDLSPIWSDSWTVQEPLIKVMKSKQTNEALDSAAESKARLAIFKNISIADEEVPYD